MVKLGNEDQKIKEQIKVADNKVDDKCENCNGAGTIVKTGDKCDHCRGKGHYS